MSVNPAFVCVCECKNSLHDEVNTRFQIAGVADWWVGSSGAAHRGGHSAGQPCLGHGGKHPAACGRGGGACAPPGAVQPLPAPRWGLSALPPHNLYGPKPPSAAHLPGEECCADWGIYEIVCVSACMRLHTHTCVCVCVCALTKVCLDCVLVLCFVVGYVLQSEKIAHKRVLFFETLWQPVCSLVWIGSFQKRQTLCFCLAQTLAKSKSII